MAKYPSIGVGTRVTSTLLNAMLPDIYLKTGTTTRTSTTTLADDPDLIVPVEANGIYLIQFWVKYSGTTTSSALIKTGWSVPSGTSFNRQVMGPGSGATDTGADNMSSHWGVHGSATAETYGGRGTTGNQLWLMEWATVTVGSTAGNVGFQWAQNVSSATGSTVNAGSYARVERWG